jgi:hypothetical protein
MAPVSALRAAVMPGSRVVKKTYGAVRIVPAELAASANHGRVRGSNAMPGSARLSIVFSCVSRKSNCAPPVPAHCTSQRAPAGGRRRSPRRPTGRSNMKSPLGHPT